MIRVSVRSLPSCPFHRFPMRPFLSSILPSYPFFFSFFSVFFSLRYFAVNFLSVSFFAVYSNDLLRSSLLNRINSMLFSVSPPPPHASSFIFLRFLIERRSRFYIRCSNFETKHVTNYEYETWTSGKARFAAKHAYLHARFWNVVFHSSLEYGTRKRISLRGNKTKTFVLINCFTSNDKKYRKFCPFSRISWNCYYLIWPRTNVTWKSYVENEIIERQWDTNPLFGGCRT